MGMNTADSTSAMPMSAPVIWSIDLRVASQRREALLPHERARRSRPPRWHRRPAGRWRAPCANMVSMLIDKPSAASTPKVPSSTTGTAMVGISVARKFCRKRNITRNTSTIASISVFDHLLDRGAHEGRGVEGDDGLDPRREGRLDGADHRLRRRAAVSRALASVARLTAMPEAGLPL